MDAAVQVYERAVVRLGAAYTPQAAALLGELCALACVRICLRVHEAELPAVLTPIAADVAVKLWRRMDYEGISSESADKLSTSFVADVLEEYADDLDAYVASGGVKRVRLY